MTDVHWLDEAWTTNKPPSLPDGQHMTVRQSNAFRSARHSSARWCWRNIVDADFQTLIRTLHVGRTTLQDIYTKLSDNGVEPAWAAQGKITRKPGPSRSAKHGDERHEWWCIICQRWVDEWPSHKDPHRPVEP